jgi:hypothetical protein
MPVSNQVRIVGVQPSDPAENIPVDIKANSAGALSVAEQVKTGYQTDVRYKSLQDCVDSYTNTAADAFSASQAFAGTCYEIIVIAETNGAILQLSRDGTDWTDNIIIPANVILGLDIKATNWKIKNRTPGSNSVYTIMGLYKV